PLQVLDADFFRCGERRCHLIRLCHDVVLCRLRGGNSTVAAPWLLTSPCASCSSAQRRRAACSLESSLPSRPSSPTRMTIPEVQAERTGLRLPSAPRR